MEPEELKHYVHLMKQCRDITKERHSHGNLKCIQPNPGGVTALDSDFCSTFIKNRIVPGKPCNSLEIAVTLFILSYR